MKIFWAGLLTVIALTGLISSGCAWQSGTDDRRPRSMFTDITLPPDLTVNESKSRVYEKPIGRVGVMKAGGYMRKEKALAYFRENMARDGWVKDSEFNNGKKHLMVFSKSPRSAAITVTDGWIGITVEIHVSDKNP